MIDIVPVRFLPGIEWIFLRDLCGKDEQRITGTKSIDAIRLLDGIIVNGIDFEKAEIKASKFTIPDRDRILAAIYINTYGTKIDTTASCTNCNKRFDIDFSLDTLMNSINPEQNFKFSVKDSVCIFSFNNKFKFRLPTGEDELAVLGIAPDAAQKELLLRCLVEGNEKEAQQSLQQAMHDLAPLIDLNFDVQCPECENVQDLHFNIQQYLLSSLLQEQKQLVFEVHRLATAYNWGLNEILELPRSIRRSYVSILDSG